MQGLMDGDEQEVFAEYIYTLQDLGSHSRLNVVGECSNVCEVRDRKW